MQLKNKPEAIYKVFLLDVSQIDRIEAILGSMSVQEKICQLIFPGITGTYMSSDSHILQKVSKLVGNGVGGLVFFKGELNQYQSLIQKFQTSSKIPLLFSADFERGLAMRIVNMVSFPHNMAVAQTHEPRLSERLGEAIAREMKLLGIHMNFAPVVDLAGEAENPVVNIRAYSDDKRVVAEFSNAFIRGAKKYNILSVLKHFPGHGYTIEDSHNELPVVNKSRQEMFEQDLYPFIECIKAGAQCVMSGHLEVPAFENQKGLPATLSYNILTGLLREEIGFQGLIITDAMNMNGVTNYYSTREAAVMALRAGNDALLLPPDEDIYIEAISDAVSNGEITVERLNESVRRILAAKIWAGLLDENRPSLEINSIANRDSELLADEIASKSLTLKITEGILPLKGNSAPVCITITDKIPTEIETCFSDILGNIYADSLRLYISPHTSGKAMDEILETLPEKSIILLPVFYRARSYQGAIKLSPDILRFAADLKLKGHTCIYLFFGNPFLSQQLSGDENIILAYSDVQASQKAALRLITGISIL